jgi:DsbC/DsbD-like thiol-disulfide interchange protein
MMISTASGVANGDRRNQSRAMKKPAGLLFCSLLSCAAPGVALASSSRWVGVEGGAVRLVTAGAPNASDGILRGALQIDLKPGWKTYWLDPGDTGVPPRISVIGATLAGIAYPVPQRFDEEGTVWNGYEAPVSFAVSLKLAGDDAKEIGAEIFLGICQSICIPLQAHLKLDPAADPKNPEDVAVVTQAFADVPSPARSGFRLTEARPEKETLQVAAELPRPDTEAELFLAAPEGYSFGPAKRLQDGGGKVIFSVPIYDRPDGAARGAEAAYTLVQDGSAVAGKLSLP